MFEYCCDITLAALDGDYGWITEMFSIILIVLFFNFFLKWILKRLHYRFEKQKKIWKDSFVQAIYTPLSSYIWFFTIIQVLELLFQRLLPNARSYRTEGHMILAIAGVLSFTWFLLRWKKKLVVLSIKKSQRHEISFAAGKIGALDKLFTIIIIFLTVMMLLEVTHSNMNTLIAFGGIGGLGVAFASQEIIANFFGGLMIYVTQPFTIGDWINLPERNIEGHVEEIGWYMTRILTFEKRPVYVPNSMFTKVIVMNPSRMSHRQFKEIIGLRYRDFDTMKPIIHEIYTMLKKHHEVDREEKILVHFKSFSPYSLDILISAYIMVTDSEDFADIKQDILFQIGDIIRKNGAEIAAPSTTVDIPDGVVFRQNNEEGE